MESGLCVFLERKCHAKQYLSIQKKHENIHLFNGTALQPESGGRFVIGRTKP